jgi:hypothetical protein
MAGIHLPASTPEAAGGGQGPALLPEPGQGGGAAVPGVQRARSANRPQVRSEVGFD